MRNMFLAIFLTHLLSMTSASAAANKLQALRTTAKNMLFKTKDNAFLQAIPRRFVEITAVGIIACGSLLIAGCEQALQEIVNTTDTEHDAANDEYPRQYTTFVEIITDADGSIIGEQHYEAYWKVTSDGQLEVSRKKYGDEDASLEHSTGKMIDNHPNLAQGVVLMSNRNDYEGSDHGILFRVYDNNYSLIEVDVTQAIMLVHSSEIVLLASLWMDDIRAPE